jgi:hypothetical protein
MIRLTALIAAVIAFLVLWHECGEDLGVFCYRIGLGAFTTVRSRTLVPVPVPVRTIPRTRAACSNRSAISSTHFTTSKD